MHTSCQSETGKIRSMFIKTAASAFKNTEHIKQYWRQLNYIDKPEYNKAVEEYDRFIKLLEAREMQLFYFPADDTVNMDSIYGRDASIATDHGIIICNMGKAARANEPAAQQKAFELEGITVLGSIKSPGTVEGGDIAWINGHTLAVGLGYRTNTEGISQLTALLQPYGIEVLTVHLPHYKGADDVFHLMSIFSPVDNDLAVVYSPLMPIAFRNSLIERGYQLIEVPAEEFDGMGCNVLALAPRECMVVDGNPGTKAALVQAGCLVTVYKGHDISVKGGGGPTCLTRPLSRDK
jgi:N-dimethylarginine dimethylaminohydrolase